MAGEISEERAMEIAERAVEEAGGTRSIYRNPRYAFALDQSTDYEVDGVRVVLRHGEISSPAVITVAGYVFEIHEEEIELLMRPPKKRVPGPPS